MLCKVFLFTAFSLLAGADIVLFPWSSRDGSFGNPIDAEIGFGNSKPISDSCAAALNTTLTCDQRMGALAADGYYASLNSSGTILCDSKCNASLASYQSKVVSACGAASVFDGYPNSYRGDVIYDFFNLVCTKEPSTGAYCPDWLNSQVAAVGNPKLLDLPDRILCSSCQLSYLRTIQGSIFWGYSGAMVEIYTEVFRRCKVNSPTLPHPPPENQFPGSQNGTNINTTCLSGNYYTVKTGDSCHSIALALSLPEGNIWAINGGFPDCSNIQVGQKICLPKACDTFDMPPDGDCWDVSNNHNITFPQFLAYNPTINPDCSNLNKNGSVVCISSPDGDWVPVIIPGLNNTWSGGEYADSVVAVPGPTPFKTTTNCGAYYQVQVADTCMRISLAAKVSLKLFMAINPQIDHECFNLIPDLWYCTHPLLNWNSTMDGGDEDPTSSTTVAAPAPTLPGTTPSCYAWYIIRSGDTCSVLTNTLGVTIAELVAWNPDLKADCSNLLLDVAYCIQGPPLAITTSATRTTTSRQTSLSPTSTSSSTKSYGGSCTKTYTVASGDWCAKIWEANGLSEAQFRALNPSLNANCDLNIGQSLCVAGSGSPTLTRTTTSAAATTTSSSCKKTYQVVSGDWCAKIWEANGLSEAQFRALNPSLNANCDLNIGQSLCVAGSTPTSSTKIATPTSSSCKKTYKVVSGDWCAKIWEANGLKEAQFRALNPTINANCDLSIGQVVCVA